MSTLAKAIEYFEKEAKEANYEEAKCFNFAAKIMCSVHKFREEKEDPSILPTERQQEYILKGYERVTKNKRLPPIPSEFYEELIDTLDVSAKVTKALKAKLGVQKFLRIRDLYEALQKPSKRVE